MNENIILIGFMGSGKTTVGQVLAKRLGYQFVDTDELIEKKAGMPIPEIFAQFGEEKFRQMESDLLAELKETLNHSVISTGGGLPLRPENASLLKELGKVAFLKITKEQVLKRLKGDTTRPLLRGDKVDEKVENLLKFRNPIYEAVSDVIVDVSFGTPDEIGKRIICN